MTKVFHRAAHLRRDNVLVLDNHFIKDGITYTAPASGRYKFGFFDESQFSSDQIMSDLNYDGNPPGSSRLFAVIWDRGTNVIWVDTNQDHSFADEKRAAITWLEKAYEQRDPLLTSIKAEPPFDPLRSDPRFQNLLTRMGLPP